MRFHFARRSFIAVTAIFALVAGALISVSLPQSASAASSSQFDPGNIIDDSVFYDGGAMTALQIQHFLNGQVSSCRTGYTCLKDYRQDTSTKPAVAGRCGQYDGTSNEAAADIIFRVGSACGISQRVLLVLLQKEQSLVTDTWPTSEQYRKATGYACPDSGSCDSAFNGFFNQVYNAALQYKKYQANPNGYNYVAGRSNNILFNPNRSCGSSDVFIQNAATAGLYNYTPYQPNAAAMANLYGTGDACSAYGNRNFWRMYTDWFGSTRGSSLMRTVSNASVFLIGDGKKYPITNQATLNAYAVLGPVSYVSQSYLDSFPTGQTAGRIIRDQVGSVYFTDAGIKLPFYSCSLVADYGGACSSTGYVQLTDGQIAKFSPGPAVTSFLSTTSGYRYYIAAGLVHEILDDASLANAGLSGSANYLTDDAIVGLGQGNPLVRDSVVVFSRSGSGYLLANSNKYTLTGNDAFTLGLSSAASRGRLSDWSLAFIANGGAFPGAVSNGQSTYFLSATGLVTSTASSVSAGISAVPVNSALIQTLGSANPIGAGSFIKSVSSGTVYVVMPTDIRPIGAWESLVALTPPGQAIRIVTLSDTAIATMPIGFVALTSGQLFRDPDNATVYLINGTTNKIGFSSFAFPAALGATAFSFTSSDRLAAYPNDSTPLTYGVMCGSTKYVTAGGHLHEVPSALANAFPFNFVQLDSFTCAQMSIGSMATSFIRDGSGSIYQLDNGQKRPILSIERYTQLSMGTAWLQVDSLFTSLIPTGPDA